MYRKQIIIGMVVVVLSWYGMMVVHEAGHCLGAVVTGAKIERVVIPIVGFSRTDVSGGAPRLIVVWGGPVFGAFGPVLLLVVVNRFGNRVRHALLFFVGFCLVANGMYIGVGVFLRAGDCGEMLRYGAPIWLLVGFGVVSSVGGFLVWHRMGVVRGWFSSE